MFFKIPAQVQPTLLANNFAFNAWFREKVAEHFLLEWHKITQK